MNTQQLAKANIDNLTQLWKLMGATECMLPGMRNFMLMTSWPYRCWPTMSKTIVEDNFKDGLEHLASNTIIPVYAREQGELQQSLLENGYHAASEQTAMALDLQRSKHIHKPTFIMSPVHHPHAIRTWTQTASHAFGYNIDNQSILNIAKRTEVHLYLVQIDDTPVATALLYKTGNVTGIHQLGVIPDYRGIGIARKIMHDLIWICQNMNSRYIVLQASKAAMNLYLELGFAPQFMIHNYKRSMNQQEQFGNNLNHATPIT